MLRTEAVTSSTLELLTKLSKDSLLKDLFLVGGTALALQIGHRLSIDLYLFSIVPFYENKSLPKLEEKYGFLLDYQERHTLKREIEGVKVDLIAHEYPLVSPLNVEQNIRMASLADIAAMKLNAIIGNGTRLRDFIDMAYLSSSLTFAEMINAYKKKYSWRNAVLVVKAINYYRDIYFKVAMQVLDSHYTWQTIKARLDQMTLHSQKRFDLL
jgi:hypothetical protein